MLVCPDREDSGSGHLVADTAQNQNFVGNPTLITDQTTTGAAMATSATDTFTYKNGNITSENQQAVGVTTHYDYYANEATAAGSSPGAIKDIVLMQNGQPISTTAYQYNANTKRLETIWVNASPGTGTSSDATLFSGTQYTVLYKSGTNITDYVSSGAAKIEWNYDNSTGRLAGITATNVAANAANYTSTYTYYPNDQVQTATVAQQTPADGSTPAGSLNYTMAYGYDAQDQLTSAQASGDANSYSYSYDGVGNRTGQFGTANNLNQFSNFSYNSRGDETGDGTYTYVWDASDHLTAIIANDNSIKVTFQYDGQGRLIEKDDATWDDEAGPDDSGAWVVSSTRKYVYDGSNLVAELDGNNALVTSYGWGPNGLMSCTDYTSGSSSPTTYLVMQDGNGNVTGLANAATGAVAATYTYDPYGRQLTATGAAAPVCNLRFAQGLNISEVEVNLFKNRFESWKGIWLSQDPAGIAGGDNLYVYCKDNPVNLTDSTGLAPQTYGPPAHVESYVAYMTAVGIAQHGQNPADLMSEGDLIRAKLYSDYLQFNNFSSLGTSLPASWRSCSASSVALTAIDQNPGLLTRFRELGTGAAYLAGTRSSPLLSPREARDLKDHRDAQYTIDMKRALAGPKIGIGEAAIPVWGNRILAIDAFADDNPGLGMLYTGLAIADIFLLKSLATNSVKLAGQLSWSLVEDGLATTALDGLEGATTATKGVLAEEAAARTMTRAGYTELPARLARNNGFDGVWIKYAANGSIQDIIITESKFSSTGIGYLKNTGIGKQLSPKWITANIANMRASADPAIQATGDLLAANKSLIRIKANVLSPDMISRWNVMR